MSQGKLFFSPVAATRMNENQAPNRGGRGEERCDLLTKRKRQIYQLWAEGNSKKNVSKRLNLSLQVKTHRSQVMEKL